MDQPTVDLAKLDRHVRLCRRNLRSDRVKCCAACPFEALIVGHAPELAELFERTRSLHGGAETRRSPNKERPEKLPRSSNSG